MVYCFSVDVALVLVAFVSTTGFGRIQTDRHHCFLSMIEDVNEASKPSFSDKLST